VKRLDTRLFGGVAFFAAALATYGGLKPRPDRLDLELADGLDALRARLDRSAFGDLEGFEDDSRRWLELAARGGDIDRRAAERVTSWAAEAAARRYLEYGELESDRRAAAEWAGPLPEGDLSADAPWLAWVVAADTATAAEAVKWALHGARPSAAIHEARAVLDLRADDLAGALGHLAAAVATAPERTATRRLFARALARRGALGSAVDAFRAGMPSASGVIHAAAADWTLRRRAEDGASSRPLGPVALGSAHPWEEGRLALLALAADPASERTSDRLAAAAAAHVDRPSYRRAVADAALAVGRVATAAGLYREALEKEPDARAAEIGLARARFASKLGRCRSGPIPRLGELVIEPSRFELVRFEPDPTIFPEDLYAELESEPDAARARGFTVANRVALAEQCLQGDRVERAARYLEQAARRGLRLVEPALIARAMLSAGRPKTALAVAEAHPTDLMMTVLRARALDALGQREAARIAIEEVATSTGALAPSALGLAARWSLESGRLDAGRHALGQLRAMAPDRLEVAILELELAERLDIARGLEPRETVELDRRVDRVLRRLQLPERGDRAAVALGRMPPAAAAALVRAVTDDGPLRASLLEAAVRWLDAPDELRLEWAEHQLGDRRTRREGRATLRELAVASKDRAVRASARRLLRR
jgi:tetratricopeptide (TPR) repeat protein